MVDLDRESEFQWKRIDRSNHIPYYIQIMHRLRAQIEDGHWPPGFHLPAEEELCRTYDVSRTVIRQALGELVNQDLIVRLRGKGTFVREPKIGESLVQKLTGFYHDMVERGYRPVTQVLEQGIVSANSRIANLLQIPIEEQVFKLTRKRSIDGVPIVLVTTYLPYELCKGLENNDFEEQSLYETLERKYGLFIVSGRRTLEAVPASVYEAQIFGIENGAPLILLDSISYLEDGTPLEYYHALHRGDRTRFEVELVRYREIGTSRRPLTDPANAPQSSVLIKDVKGDSKLDD